MDIWTYTPIRRLKCDGCAYLERDHARALIASGSATYDDLVFDGDMPPLVRITRHDISCTAWYQANNEDIDNAK